MAYPRDCRSFFVSLFFFSFLPSLFPLPPRDSIRFFRYGKIARPRRRTS